MAELGQLPRMVMHSSSLIAVLVLIIVSLSFGYSVSLQEAPRITTRTVNVTAPLSQSLILTCNANGSEPITWDWDYSGKCDSLVQCWISVIRPDGSFEYLFKQNMRNGSFRIYKTRLQDSGDYWCKASNSYGNDSHRISVIIRKIVYVDGEFQQYIDNFNPDLLDPNTAAYKAAEQQYKSLIDLQFKERPWYKETQILGFKNVTGNRLLVSFRVVADISDTTPELVAEDVAGQFQRLLESSQSNQTIPDTFKLKVRPLAPQNLRTEEIEENLAFISWDLPKFYDYFNIDNYTVHFKKSSQDKWLVADMGIKFSNITSYKLKNLDQSSDYEVRMFAWNRYGMSEPSQVLKFKTDSTMDFMLIALISAGCIILIILFITVLVCVCRRRKPHGFERARREIVNIEEDGPCGTQMTIKNNFYAASYKKYLDGRIDNAVDGENPTWWEISEDKLELGEVIGSGEFGVVVKGVLDTQRGPTDCAVKMLKEYSTAQEYKDLFNELALMTGISRHPNLVNLIGACTTNDHLMIVVEYCANGNLLKYLQTHSGPDYINVKEDESTLCYVRKLQIAWDIAKGMAHLEYLKCAHRDLAARNVLLTDTLQAKVSDFGMSRDVYEKGFYEKTTEGKLPIKWMAIESLQQMQFSSKSDVWSFGVVLWEIETGGQVPYPGILGRDMLAELLSGRRLEKPPNCNDDFYLLMELCWDADPQKRPIFQELVDEIEVLLSNESGYLPMYPLSDQNMYEDPIEEVTLELGAEAGGE